MTYNVFGGTLNLTQSINLTSILEGNLLILLYTCGTRNMQKC